MMCQTYIAALVELCVFRAAHLRKTPLDSGAFCEFPRVPIRAGDGDSLPRKGFQCCLLSFNTIYACKNIQLVMNQ